MAQIVKNLPAMWEAQFYSLGWEDPLEKDMATLQDSCLENPMDRGAWKAIILGIAKCHKELTEPLTLSLFQRSQQVTGSV